MPKRNESIHKQLHYIGYCKYVNTINTMNHLGVGKSIRKSKKTAYFNLHRIDLY